jgi:hypothetical protein
MPHVALLNQASLHRERRRRMVLARRLEDLVAEADHPHRRPGAVSARVSLDGAEVRRARTVLLELAVELRSEAPVRAEGLRQVRDLLTDGTGPVYLHRYDGDVTGAAEAALRALRVD